MGEDIDRAVEAVGKIEQISRARRRREFEQRFTDRHRAEDHIRIYQQFAQPFIDSSSSLELLQPCLVPGCAAIRDLSQLSMGFSQIRHGANPPIRSWEIER
jgi:hypothetical protein